VVVVSSGRDALDRCRTEPFDCILCDVMMPDLSGPEVHATLRADGLGIERRIIFVTGGAVTDAARSALANTDNRILEKPVDMTLLRSAVAAMVSAPHAPSQAPADAAGDHALGLPLAALR
jgi:two-component system cell cycle sensor histidine kinase/response regulator CckA